MKPKYTATLALMLALTACSETATGPNPGPQYNSGVAAPGTEVVANFEITEPEQTTITYRAAPRNNQGSCGAEGVWTNNGGRVSNPGHEQCTDVVVTPGSTVEVEFSAIANFVLAKSGNTNLNFSAVCIYVLDPLTNEEVCTYPGRSVQYKKNSDWTDGQGMLFGEGSDGSVWTIDLSQIGRIGNALGERRIGNLLASRVGSAETYGAVTVTW